MPKVSAMTAELQPFPVPHDAGLAPKSTAKCRPGSAAIRNQRTPLAHPIISSDATFGATSSNKDHILSRSQVTENAVHAAFQRRRGRQRFIIHPNRTVSLNPQDSDPTSI